MYLPIGVIPIIFMFMIFQIIGLTFNLFLATREFSKFETPQNLQELKAIHAIEICYFF